MLAVGAVIIVTVFLSVPGKKPRRKIPRDVSQAVKPLAIRDPAEKSGGWSKSTERGQSAGSKADEVRGEGAYVGLRDRTEDKENAADGVSGDDNTIVESPPRTKALSFSVEEKDGLRESIAKLESSLAPDELQVFYTGLLLKDWIIFRDNLTEGVGWNGIFLQIDDKQRRLGIFAVVKEIGATSVESLPTRISIIKVEEM